MLEFRCKGLEWICNKWICALVAEYMIRDPMLPNSCQHIIILRSIIIFEHPLWVAKFVITYRDDLAVFGNDIIHCTIIAQTFIVLIGMTLGAISIYTSFISGTFHTTKKPSNFYVYKQFLAILFPGSKVASLHASIFFHLQAFYYNIKL